MARDWLRSAGTRFFGGNGCSRERTSTVESPAWIRCHFVGVTRINSRASTYFCWFQSNATASLPLLTSSSSCSKQPSLSQAAPSTSINLFRAAPPDHKLPPPVLSSLSNSKKFPIFSPQNTRTLSKDAMRPRILLSQHNRANLSLNLEKTHRRYLRLDWLHVS